MDYLIFLPMQKTLVGSQGWEDSPGEGNGNPLQYSCLGNPIDRGEMWVIVHGIIKRAGHSLATKQHVCVC